MDVRYQQRYSPPPLSNYATGEYHISGNFSQNRPHIIAYSPRIPVPSFHASPLAPLLVSPKRGETRKTYRTGNEKHNGTERNGTERNE